MNDPDQRERYRQMTGSERLRIAMRMTEEHLQTLLAGPPEVVDEFFDNLRRENDEECRLLVEGFARIEAGQRIRETNHER